MSDMRTVRQAITELYEIPLSGNHVTRLNLCIAKALHDLRPLKFQWNVEELSIVTVASQASYVKGTVGVEAAAELPGDMLAVQGPTLRCSISNVSYGIEQIPRSEYQRLRPFMAETSPQSWLFWDDKLWLLPIPGAVFTIAGHVHMDLGTPLPVYSGSAWTYEVWGSAINEDTYSNAWFTEAFGPLVNRTAYYYQKLFKKDPGGAELARSTADEQLQALLAEYGIQEEYGELASRGAQVSGRMPAPPEAGIA